jgi:hypothetical protein
MGGSGGGRYVGRIGEDGKKREKPIGGPHKDLQKTPKS